MQTFLAYPSFSKSASCLDNKRLGKQRVEAWQIYKTLTDGSRWENHPAVKMWKGCESGLILYGIFVCNEWIRRGFKDTLKDRFLDIWDELDAITVPSWLGKKSFHSVHKSILLGKNYEWYKQFEWKEKPAVKNNEGRWPYIWPV